MKIKGNVLEFLAITVRFSIVYSCTETNIRNLTDLDLRGPNITLDFLTIGNGIFLNDDKLPAGWYRTIYNGWQYIMCDVDNIPNFATCSTIWPMYLSESHPPIGILSENPLTLKACRRDISPCTTPTKIQVRKCKEEIQYYLVRTRWYSAYCFEQKLPLKIPAPAPSYINLNKVVVSPELNFITYDRGFMTSYTPYIIFRCKFDNQMDLFYSVNWYVDNKPFYETLGPTKNLTELTLHEDILVSHKITLPIQLRCGVSASSNHDGLKTPEVFSPQFYAGMKILNRNIFLDKASTATVQMVSTIPIGCQYFLTKFRFSTGRPPCYTEVKVFVDNRESLNCSKLFSIGSVFNLVPPSEEYNFRMCAKYIKTYTASEKWEPDKVENFTVVTSDHTYEDKSEFILRLAMGNNIGHKLWEDYVFPDVKIYVQNTNLYNNKVCKVMNNRHMYTFDGYNYEQQIEGTFILYLNVKYGIEVQQTVKDCTLHDGSFSTCTCGVAVSAGQDIFMINRCGKVSFIGFTNCGDGGILDVVRIHDRLYKVLTPIGTAVKIRLSWRVWMNVQIYMAPKDFKNVFGLCGYADGNKSNDLRHRNSDKVSPLGKASTWEIIHHDFMKSWKTEHLEENLFQPTFKKRPKWAQQNGLYCVCDSRVRVDRALCSPTQYLNCRKVGSITEMKCHVEGRRKRNTGDHSDKEIRRLLHKMQPVNRRQKREVRKNFVISDEAAAFCGEKFNGILALNAFKNLSANDDQNVVTSWCAFDLSISNDTFWADVHIEALNDGVKNMMDLQPTYVKTNTQKVEFFLKNTCPMNCTGIGNCSDSGACSCFKYYHGPDCSIDERNALEISDIQGGGECDIAEGDECECFYVRSDSIQSNLTCSVATSKIAVNGDVVNISTDIIKGVFEDIFTGICCIPGNIKGLEDVFVAKYGVHISNNGYNFGNEENVYVFDSTCQEVKNTMDGDKIFSLKEKHCFIQGFCFADNDMAPSGCSACVSSSALYSWTEYNPCKNGGTCSDEEIGYSCACVDGYRGINCEYEFDECESNPCLNGGVCSDKFNGYICTCEKGYTGRNCEININECASHPCKNGGQCIDQVNMYTCTCTAGYQGAHCEIVARDMLTKPASVCDLFGALNGKCNHGSQCTLLGGSPTCVDAKFQEEYQTIIIALGCTGAFLLFAIVFVSTWRYKRRSPSYDLSAATRREFGKTPYEDKLDKMLTLMRGFASHVYKHLKRVGLDT